MADIKVRPLVCTKCRAFSGNDWTQCIGGCPVKGSPYFEQAVYDKYGVGLIPATEEDMGNGQQSLP